DATLRNTSATPLLDSAVRTRTAHCSPRRRIAVLAQVARLKLRALFAPQNSKPKRARLPAAKQRAHSLLDSARAILVARRVFRCSPDQAPFVLFPTIPVDRKRNRAERCGGRPIYDRYRTKRSPGEPADC